MSIEDLKATYIAARAARAETVKTYNRLFMALADKIEEMEADFQAANAPIMVVESVEKKQFETFAKAQIAETDTTRINAAGLDFVTIKKAATAVLKGV